MKLKIPQFRLPKIGWPKFSLPKFSLPKLSRPKFSLPKFSLPKVGLPRLKLNRRNMVVGASALALLGAGGSAWFFVRPLLSARANPPQETAQEAAGATAQAPAEKAAEAAQQQAGSKGAPAAEGQEIRSAQEKAKAEAAPDKSGAAAQGPAGQGEKTAAAPLPASVSEPAPPGEPEQLIRRLQEIQDHVAAGDAAAFAEMPRLLRTIAQKFVAQPPEAWSRKQNARALILYLLSGGSSATGRKILAEHTFAASEEPMARGAIAYLENIEGADRDYLRRVDPRSLDLELAAQVAFVQAILLSGTDPRGAIARLDLARLLAPGGLVEEAALRREVALLSETKEFDKFAALARQYWQRYRASPYTDNFLRQFMLAIVRVSQSIKLSEWAQLTEFIDGQPPETRRKLYLTMARTAAVVGNVDLAAMAAQNAFELSPADSIDRQRALLFRAAAKVSAADFAESRLLLRDIDRSRLPPGDQPLFDAVAMALARIFRPPEQQFAATPPGAGNATDADLARAETSAQGADAVIDSVRKTMERKSR